MIASVWSGKRARSLLESVFFSVRPLVSVLVRRVLASVSTDGLSAVGLGIACTNENLSPPNGRIVLNVLPLCFSQASGAF